MLLSDHAPTLMRLRFLHCFLPVIATLLPLCTFAANDANTIVIAQIIDLSSPNAAIGRDYVAGIKTGFDTLNAAGGINGTRIRYIVRDDQASPAIAAKAAAELIEREQVDYLLGGVGDDVMQAILDAPAFQHSNLTLYAALANAAGKNNARVLFWRPPYLQEVRHIFSHFSQLGMKNIGIVYQDDVATHAAFRNLTMELRGRGLNLSGSARISSDDKKNLQEAERLAATKPGFVVVIADTINTALFLKTFRAVAPQTFVAGTSLINLETLRELAGTQAVEWTVFSQVVPSPNAGKTPIQLEHVTMMKKYRDEPASSLTLEGFIVARSLASIIQQSKRPVRMALQDVLTQHTRIDLGGLSIQGSSTGNALSAYLDIALFKKTGLVF